LLAQREEKNLKIRTWRKKHWGREAEILGMQAQKDREDTHADAITGRKSAYS